MAVIYRYHIAFCIHTATLMSPRFVVFRSFYSRPKAAVGDLNWVYLNQLLFGQLFYLFGKLYSLGLSLKA
jgi:hypothetical protein